MDNDIILDEFDEIGKKVDFLIELCKNQQFENDNLRLKVEKLEAELDKKNEIEERHSEYQAVIRSKIDGLLTRFDNLSGVSKEKFAEQK